MVTPARAFSVFDARCPEAPQVCDVYARAWAPEGVILEPSSPAPEELAEVPKTPGSLDEALAALRKDHEFMLRGDVFTPDVIDTWIWYKTEKEADAMRLRPHPYEFALYYDI